MAEHGNIFWHIMTHAWREGTCEEWLRRSDMKQMCESLLSGPALVWRVAFVGWGHCWGLGWVASLIRLWDEQKWDVCSFPFLFRMVDANGPEKLDVPVQLLGEKDADGGGRWRGKKKPQNTPPWAVTFNALISRLIIRSWGLHPRQVLH